MTESRLTACLTIVGNLIVFVGTMWLVVWWVIIRWIRHIRGVDDGPD